MTPETLRYAMKTSYQADAGRLRKSECEVWEEAESRIPTNSSIFTQIVAIHFELLLQAHNRNPESKNSRFERAMRLMAARCAHILRGMWISAMAGYPGTVQPLARALYETSLTMYYLRNFPGDFGPWIKKDKSSDEQKRFWPSEMTSRMKAPEIERQIYSGLAEAAHPNPPALSRLAAYDAAGDALEISVGQVLSQEEARRISAEICLFAALSTYNVARTVKDALVDGLPNDEQLQELLGRLKGLTDLLEKDAVRGTTVFDMFAKRVRR